MHRCELCVAIFVLVFERQRVTKRPPIHNDALWVEVDLGI